jgi:23S rRNA (guanosine2251-2'-O)-methyltransferase
MRKLKTYELGRPDVEEFLRKDKLPVVAVLDNVRSMLNVGSIFRTCDAFAVEKLILCGITGQPPHRDIQKTALGSTESVAWEYFQSVVEALKILKSEGYVLIGVEQTDESISLSNFQPEQGIKYAFLFGNEVEGLSDEALPLLDRAIEIPQSGTKHSLNVAVAAGIVVWQVAEFDLK